MTGAQCDTPKGTRPQHFIFSAHGERVVKHLKANITWSNLDIKTRPPWVPWRAKGFPFLSKINRED
jgi:hypothetical protein